MQFDFLSVLVVFVFKFVVVLLVVLGGTVCLYCPTYSFSFCFSFPDFSWIDCLLLFHFVSFFGL